MIEPIIYRCGFSIESKGRLKEGHTIRQAKMNINSVMKKILKTTDCDEYFGYLTSNDKSNFRFKIFPEYKANRKNATKPIYYDELREYMVKHWDAEIVSGQEADDACSIKHCRLNAISLDTYSWNTSNTHSIVCSFDKDFNNIPGWHYNYVKDEVYYVDEKEALRNFYLQILTGDTSDGIPRVSKGWKKKETEKRLKEALTEEEMQSIILEQIRLILELKGYIEQTTMERDILMQRGQLVWLRRKEGELWTPKY